MGWEDGWIFEVKLQNMQCVAQVRGREDLSSWHLVYCDLKGFIVTDAESPDKDGFVTMVMSLIAMNIPASTISFEVAAYDHHVNEFPMKMVSNSTELEWVQRRSKRIMRDIGRGVR